MPNGRQTFGQRCMALMQARREGLLPGVGLTTPECAEIIDREFELETRERKRAKKIVPRDLLFEQLALECRINLAELTDSQRGALNRGRQQILAAMPGATPHDVSCRAAVYRRRFPNITVTVGGLVKQWPALGVGVAKAALMEAPEPSGWQVGLRQILAKAGWSDGSIDALIASGWPRLSDSLKRQLLAGGQASAAP